MARGIPGRYAPCSMYLRSSERKLYKVATFQKLYRLGLYFLCVTLYLKQFCPQVFEIIAKTGGFFGWK